MDIEGFYAEDERRRQSPEAEYGTDWHDADGARYELSWIADTGELYVMREPLTPMTEDPFGDVYRTSLPVDELTVAVVGWVPDEAQVERILSGWEDAMAKPNSIAWLVDRLRDEGVPRQPPAG